MECIELTELANGLRVVTETVPHVQSVSVGVWVGAGSRCERAAERGITHFIEHMLFKGTGRRTARDIAHEIESRGGSLNAFTEKEYTCYYARALADDVALTMDVLADMLRCSALDSDEISREQNVVLEEIKRYEDTPDDAVHDLFARTVWPSHPLGRTIVGTPRTVCSFTRDDLQRYMGSHYGPSNTVIATAGNVPHQTVVDLARRWFGDMSPTPGRRVPRAPSVRISKRQKHKRTEQVHFCIGGPAYSLADPRRYALSILDLALGGNMSSRLFQEIRERRGLAYSIGSYTSAYRECGLLTVFGGTSIETFGEATALTMDEIRKVRADGLTEAEVTTAKTQIRGALVLGLEGMTTRMMRMGKSMLCYGRVIPIDEVVASVEAVTSDDVHGIAAEVLEESRLGMAAIGPVGRARGIQ